MLQHPLSGLSLVDLIVDGQRLLGFVPLTSSLTASIRLLDLSPSTSLVDHFRHQPHCRPPASAGLSSSLTSSSTASVRWTYFVVNLIVDGQRPLDLLCRPHCRRPASAGITLSTLSSKARVRWAYFVNIVIDGQHPLGLLC